MMRFVLLLSVLWSGQVFCQELAVSATRNLDFGTVTQGQAPVTIPTQNNNPSNARFTVTGPARTRYSLILPTMASLIHFPAGDTLTINNFTASPNNLRLDNSGTQELVIGATLQAIPLNQRGGNYAGNFTVEVILN